MHNKVDIITGINHVGEGHAIEVKDSRKEKVDKIDDKVDGINVKLDVVSDNNHVGEDPETGFKGIDNVTDINSVYEESETGTGTKEDKIILYKKRWFILILFISYSFLNAYQWIHLNIVSDRVIYFWNHSLPSTKVEQDAIINLLSVVYMIAYIPLIIPAMWFLENKGLRGTSLIAAFLNALGAWVKCAAISLDGKRFAVLMTGQAICGISQVFILGIPAHLAAVWFGANEVSTATSLGVFGNQLGVGFGFVLPPQIFSPVNSNSTMIVFEHQFSLMLYIGATVMTLLFIFIYFVFDNKPPTPPSWGQMNIHESAEEFDYKDSIMKLAKNPHYVSLVFSYGINTAVFYSISTLLNLILLHYFTDNQSNVGIAGLLMIVSGIIGSVLIGIILDKTKAFKISVVVVYSLSLLGMAAFTGGLYLKNWPIIFAIMFFLGFFMTGYLPLGFELAAEMTYPINEGLTSGLINLSAQILSIGFIYLGSIILNHTQPVYCNLSFVVFLIVGLILTIFMKIDFKRQEAQNMVIN